MKHWIQRSERGAATQKTDTSHASENVPASVEGMDSASAEVLGLQRVLGNQAVLRMLRGRLPTKLDIGASGGFRAHESDRVPEQRSHKPLSVRGRERILSLSGVN